MWLLSISVAALFVGPILTAVTRRDGRIVHGIDGFVLVAMGGLVLLHLLPHSLEAGGEPAAVAGLCGLGLPLLVHRLLHGDHGHDHSDGGARERPEPALLLLVAGLALLVHALIDGAAIAAPALLPHAAHGHAAHGAHKTWRAASAGTLPLLAGAVLLHRLPIGIALWWSLAPRYGRTAAVATLLLMSGATVGGFFGADLLAPGFAAMNVFQAFVAGALLHVIFHTHVAQPQNEPCGYTGILGDPRTRAAGVGAILGLFTLALVDGSHPVVAVGSEHLPTTDGLVALLLTCAPAALAAFVVLGLLRAVVLRGSHSGTTADGSRDDARRAFQGTVLGMLLPIRPCSVAPLFTALTERGVPRSAAIAMLAAAPSLGVDAVLISLPLLGVPLTMTRIAATFACVWAAAWLVSRRNVGRRGRRSRPTDVWATILQMWVATSHAANDVAAPNDTTTRRDRLRDGLRFGVIDLFDAVAPWLVFGLVLGAIAEAMLDIGPFTRLPAGLDVLALGLAGLPVYISAVGGTPIVAVLLHKGLSPGAGLAFLLVAAGTSRASIRSLRDAYGRGAAVWFVVSLLVGAMITGALINALSDPLTLPQLHSPAGQQAVTYGVVNVIAAGLLGLGLLVALLRKGPRGLIDRVVAAHGPAHGHHLAGEYEHRHGAPHEHNISDSHDNHDEAP